MTLRRFAVEIRLPILTMLLLLVCPQMLFAAPLPARDVPDPLKPWIPWVMQGQEARFCPPAHDDGNRRLCHWPSRVALELGADGGRFEMGVTRLAPGWVMLPGDGPRWPQEVSVDGRAAPVLDRYGVPSLWVETGTHRVQGRFAWKTLPESLRVPPEAGLIELTLNGRGVPHPQRDERQQLWLGRRAVAADAQAERLELRVFRMIDDDIPLTVTTQIEINAGGEVREEIIGPVMLPGLLPLAISGDLPARLEDDGRLRVQLRPGQWRLTLVARSTAPVTQLTAAPAHEQWADQEIWSLQTHHELRVIEPSGVSPTDPRQVGVPAEWQHMPAFLVEPGNTLKLTETQRGSPDLTPDQLTLQRQLWLDFDGGGFTVQDQLGGRLARTWRLEAQAPIALGRVQVDNEPQLITKQGQGVGVEVRHGVLNLVADSRIEDGARRIPAGGWNTDLQGINTTLHLPPAWRLLAAPGVDNVPDTWLARWSLLDLFLVLIASIAALRLFGRTTAALTLVTLALTWHEPSAPRWTWLNLIAAIALLRALPASFDGSGRLRKLLLGYQWVAAGILALVALPFAVQQARISLYPQLEVEYGFANFGGMAGGRGFDMAQQQANVDMDAGNVATMEMEAQMSMPAPAAPMVDEMRQTKEVMSRRAKSVSENVSQASIQKLDPNVLTQTGPGLPAWGWRQASLNWSGPVTSDQDFRLWLMPPWLTRTLGWLSIALIALLAMRWLQVAPRLPRLPLRGAASAAVIIALGATTLLATPSTVHAQDPNALMPPQPQPPPPPAVLDELRERLTAPPDCLPHCANWARLGVEVSGGERLNLRLIAEAQVDTALPLPVPRVSAGQSRVWQPQAVLLDDRAADLLRDEAGALWLRVPAGRHTVVVSGDLTGFAQVQLPTSPAPRQASAEANGWLVTGIDAQGQPGSVIDLIRERRDDTPSAGAAEEGGSAQQLPPLLRLTRTLQLGLVWSAQSTLTREGSAQGASIVTLPALPGEVVTGDSVRVAAGRIQASFAPGQRAVTWSSRLATVEKLALEAGSESGIIETWRFDVSPLWHVDFAGLAAVSNQEGDWRLVTFRPWPGEKVQAQITRPVAVQGQVMTLDSAELGVQPGMRATDYTLALLMRASQGGQHVVTLPAGLSLQGLDIDGQAQPARLEGERVILPLRPGAQTLTLRLRSDEGLGKLTSTPAFAPGTPGVNARIHVQLPPDRWVLLVGGPALGPAVLFWGVLAVLVVVALGLGRVGLTPLKGLQWALLMIGLSQVPIAGAAVVAGWLFALALRARVPEHWSAGRFNLMQVLLAIWTVVALGTLFGAVAQGLLGQPDMQIAGNGSSAYQLMWYQDRFQDTLPRAWVLSVSIWFYRGLMLLWALWLANSLLNWLRWGWSQYSAGGLWRKKPVVVTPPAAPAAGETP
ncbi:MAG: hypothetical protein K0Q76_2317 [Panacagrimonas sp.]|jgi:hypothetical protein|nr:hypothetical protein [Panacagrimonas sp.]MCC2657209.1 hypothetical protein [Panacagrimonas sp.]